MRPVLVLLVTLAFLLVAAAAGAGEGNCHGAAAAKDPRFDFLKRLEGTWVSTSGDDEMSGGVFEFRVTAGGHAVEEREMVGTPMEMVTLYHMDGKELAATHYCMLGNQPHLTAAEKVVDDTLSFSCTGTPGNAGSHDEEHVHGWSMRLAEDGRLHYTAELVKNGEVTEAPALVLTRQTEAARR
jgi:hypothetical protein